MTKLRNAIPMEKKVSRQFRLWERSYQRRKHEGGSRLRPCITISKEIGSLGAELGRQLSQTLEWEFLDKSLVDYVANDAHRMKEVIETFDERTQSELHTFILGFLDRNALSGDRYFKHLVTVLLSIKQHGHAIILGRGGNFVLSPHDALRVRVVASLESRIRNLIGDGRMGEKEARQTITTVERERHAFIRRFFHKDADNALYYDLVLNTTNLTLPAAEKIVVQALHAKFPTEDRKE